MLENVSKRKIINLLFVVSFPLYGIGLYVAAAMTPTAGYLLASLAYMVMMLFHLVDLLYKRDFSIRINGYFWIHILYLLSTVASLFYALHRKLPETELSMLLVRSVLITAPFLGFIIVNVYNIGRKDIARLTLTGLSLLLLINLFGYYVLGMSNEVHSIEGRINFPFLDGLYSGACLIAIINLLLFYKYRQSSGKPITHTLLILYFVVNLFFLFHINSRLVTLVSMLVLLLMIFNVTRTFKGVFTASIFTLPLLLSGGLLIYEILSLPLFQIIMQRVDLLDVVTFHGRSFIWQDGMDWLLEDQRGFWFGNGYKGHYFIDLLGDIVKLFDLDEVHHLHMHSTTLEIAVSQGIFGLLLFLMIWYRSFQYFKIEYKQNSNEGAFLPIVIFMIFISHVDVFVYMDNLGAMLMSLVVSRICIKTSVQPVPGKYGIPLMSEETAQLKNVV